MSAAPASGSERMIAAMTHGPRFQGGFQRARAPGATLRRLGEYFAPFRPALAGVAACVIGSTVAGLAGPWLMGVAIDRCIGPRQAAGLAGVLGWMLLAYGLSNLLQAGGNLAMARVSQGALRDLRRDLFVHVQTLPVAFFDQNPAGELMSRLTNDIDAISQAAAQGVTSLLASLLSMAGILVAMFVLDFWLALASLLVVPLMLWFTRLIAVATRPRFQDLQRSLGALNAVMEESIAGTRVVKLFRRKDAVLARFREANQEACRAGIEANTWAMLLMPLTAVLGNLFVIVLAGLGGALALSGLVSVGVIATFINYGQNFVNPLRQLSLLGNAVQSALAGAERVFDVVDAPGEVDLAALAAARPAPRGEVRFEHVGFSYRPGTPVLRDVCLEAAPGDLVALVGPTGAGKTTVMNLLTRFYEIDEGRISLDGLDLREWPKSELRRRLGLVLQDSWLFSATVMENIRYGRLEASDDEVVRAATLADADHFIRQLPQGYETLLSERAGNLSQGQRQLLAIARTLLADPSILLLDEATSSVDTRTELRLQRALAVLMKGRTSFVIAHRLSTIRDAKQLLVIDQGRIVERGTHESLLSARGVYHRLWSSQFKGEAT